MDIAPQKFSAKVSGKNSFLRQCRRNEFRISWQQKSWQSVPNEQLSLSGERHKFLVNLIKLCRSLTMAAELCSLLIKSNAM